MLSQMMVKSILNCLCSVSFLFMVLHPLDALALQQSPEAAANKAQAQEDSTADFDLLIAPASPGFVLLDKAPSSIERPGTVTDLAITVFEQTEDLSSIPNNFAVEFSPFWLVSHPGLTYNEYNEAGSVFEKGGRNVFLQTLSFSIATTTEKMENSAGDDVSITSLAAGARFSLFRGKVDDTPFQEHIKEIHKQLGILNDAFGVRFKKAVDSDPTLSLFKVMKSDTISAEKRKAIDLQITAVREKIKEKVEQELRTEKKATFNTIKSTISKIKYKRLGFKLDLAGGIVLEFPNRDFEAGELRRWGSWLTGGYEGKNITTLGVLRYLGHRAGQDSSSFDIGGRLIYSTANDKFSFSGEAVYRKILKENENLQNKVESSWRLALLLDYAIAKNRKLSFTFGRDFKGKTSGNLISAVNLIFGIGSKRPVM